MFLYNLNELFIKLKNSKIEKEEDLSPYIKGTLEIFHICPGCQKFNFSRKTTIFKINIRCTNCYKKMTIRENIKLKPICNSYLKLIYFIFYYANDFNLKQMHNWLNMSKKTLCKNLVELQTLFYNFETTYSFKLGGPDDIVEVDETCFGRRKYNLGRSIPQIWIWGAISRNTNRFIMRNIPSKRKEVLKPLIENHINHGTTVFSDQFATYLSIFRENMEYNHEYVNHKYNFLNPSDKTIHTQCIESLWSRFKKWKNRKGYSKRRYIKNYASEYTLCKIFEDDSYFKWFEFIMKLVFE